jgi:hypothetical protein
MKTIVRVYTYPNGKEVCHSEVNKIIELLSKPAEELDLDYLKENGHAKIGTSRDLMGEEVKIGDTTLTIPQH